MSEGNTNVDAGKHVSGRTAKSDAEIILKASLRNLAHKVAEGHVLTAAETKLLTDSMGENSPDANESDYAKNQSALANALGVSRKSIERYKKRPDAPAPRADGRLCISAWRTYLAQNNVLDDEDSLDVPELKAKQLVLQNQKLAHQLSVMKGEYVSIQDVEIAVGEMIEQAKKILLSGPSSIAPRVVGESIPEAEKILREWLHGAMSKLSANPLGKDGDEPG